MTARALFLLLLPLLAACQREEREVRADPVATETQEKIALSPLSPGASGPVIESSAVGRSYETNAFQISQGQRWYRAFNCNGCHANGGGDSGPALMDDRWIYGGEIENIAATIREGRPNGMPSFRGKITDDQVWQLAAYVRSMGRLTPKAAAPTRTDHMHPGMGESRRPSGQVVPGGQAIGPSERPE